MGAATVELPLGLMVLGSAYIAFTIVISAALSLLLAPVLTINRRKAAFFDDWNFALKAPWLFWHIGGLWYRAAELLGNYVLPAPQRVSDLASGYFRSQVVISLTQLGVPDALRHGPKTGAQLAAELQAHQPYLERVLRAAERLQLVAARPAAGATAAARAARRSGGSGGRAAEQQQQQQQGGGGGSGRKEEAPRQRQQQQQEAAGAREEGGETEYRLTQLSAVLCEDHVNSVKHMVLLFGEHYGPFGRLADGVRAGQVPYRLWSGGLGHWEHMGKAPELYKAFNRAMAAFNNLCPIAAVFMEVDLARFARLVDVGGGLGALAAAALEAAPRLNAALFDLPHVVQQAQQVWQAERAALLPRVTFTPGSFFEAGQVPSATSGRDVYVLRQILHDWSDAECITILRQVRAAIGAHADARLLIVEACLSSDLMTSTHTPRALGDVHMLVQYGDAGERSEAQFARLLAAAGFRLDRVQATKSLFFALEAAPV